MREPGAVVIAFMKHKHLSFVFQAPKCRRVDYTIAVTGKIRTGRRRRFRHKPAPAGSSMAGIGLKPFHRPLRNTAIDFSTANSEIPGMTTPALTVTSAAAKRILEITAADKAALRVAVNGGGCSGFQYEFKLEKERAADDSVFERDGATVLVDSVSLELMAGSTVDFVDDLMGQSFRVQNPQAKSSCGCGTSFSL
jgi:iron-sulfur cluster assembly accessory protein